VRFEIGGGFFRWCLFSQLGVIHNAHRGLFPRYCGQMEKFLKGHCNHTINNAKSNDMEEANIKKLWERSSSLYFKK